jgi:tRNA pseudouridine38-40 synthase
LTQQRYFLSFAYNGTAYHGWQKQANAISVQQDIENALSLLLGESTELLGAGRTDTGVHAKQMFAHFDSSKELDGVDIVHRLNSFLGEDIAFFGLYAVSQKAHARFSATYREYEYHLHFEKDPFKEKRSFYFRRKLDRERMNEAAHCLLNYSEFSAFTRSNDGASNHRCDLMKSEWQHFQNSSIFTIRANRFLRNMVRAIVGTLLEVGEGRLSINEFEKIIESGDRRMAGESAPAHGLYLTEIGYPKEITACLK